MMSRRQTARLAEERLRALSRSAYTAAAGHLAIDPEPAGDRPARRRWAVAPRAALAAVTVVVLVGLAVGVRSLSATDPRPPASVAVTAPGWSTAEEALREPSPPGPADEGREASESVVVHVAGQVASPGVQELPGGSRVHDALDAAGGASRDADLAAVNLARTLVDGEQVYVPAVGEAPRPGAAPPAGAAAGGGSPLVNLNLATAEELDALPGIGPVLAGRIVEWRTEHGRFTAFEELAEVSGIGPAVLGRLRDRVTL